MTTRFHFCYPMRLPVAALALAASAAVLAQSVDVAKYPIKPVRLIVPYPAGGPTDLNGRAVARPLGERLGQSIIVDNRGGAATIIGTELAAHAPADGYTLLVATVTTLAANPALNRRLPYDPVRDFAPVAMLGTAPYVMVINPKLPVKSTAEFIAYARAYPGKLSFGSAGTGSSAHLAGELLKTMAGIDILHVPYKGGNPATMDLIAGQIAMQFSSVSVIKPHVDGGRLRALAVTTAKRSAIWPELPTVAEGGVPGFQTRTWNCLVAPRGTPPAIITRLNREVNAIVATPEVGGRMREMGIETEAGTPAALAAYIADEIARFHQLVIAIKLPPTG